MVTRNLTLYPQGIAAAMPILCNYKSGAIMYRVLVHIGIGGLSTRGDIARAIGLNISTRKSKDVSFRRISRACHILEKELGLIEQKETRLNHGIKYFLLRLTTKGKTYCRKHFLWGKDIVMSDWDKLISWHNGENQGAHSAMVLNFAYHARLRGWHALVMPRDTENNTRPDVLISNDKTEFYIEVERKGCRTKLKPQKWANQFKTQNSISACYASMCAAQNAVATFIIMGYATFQVTSLEYLQKNAYVQSNGLQRCLWQFTSEEIFNV